MVTNGRPRVLCVDDERHVLEALRDTLRRNFDVVTATSGAEGLEALRAGPSFAIVLSDMRMPGMDGATLLGHSRQLAPDTVRMLLTGHADLEVAVRAVNEGQLFRFLIKPCPLDQLRGAFEAAAEQHRLITAERVLLEETLTGSINLLTDTLALTNPAAFGRAMRVKQYVSELAEQLGLRERWPVEVAAMLSQVACVTLPAETAEKLYHGRALDRDERAMVERLPQVTEKLLQNIPRLELVRAILAEARRDLDGKSSSAGNEERATVTVAAQALRIALDFDLLEAQGQSSQLALDTMRGRGPLYEPGLLDAFARLRGIAEQEWQVKELAIGELVRGMVLADDMVTGTGILLVARGHEITPGLLARLRNFKPGSVREPVRVSVPASA